MMKNSCFLICYLLCCTTAHAADTWTISSRGLGPIHAGITIEQAAHLLKSPLTTYDNAPLEVSCDFVYPSQDKDRIAFMVSDGHINHAVISTPDITTRSGAKVGDSTARLKSLFGAQLQITPHEYEEGFYYFIWENSHSYGVKFEVVNDKVVQIYAGDESIQFVEGCS